MTLYRSLLYRKMKMARKKFLIRLILALYIMAGVLNTESIRQEYATYYVLIFAIIGGLNYGVRNMDDDSGWKRYSYVLPITPFQYALLDSVLLLANMALFGMFPLLIATIMPTEKGLPVPDACAEYIMFSGIISLLHYLYCSQRDNQRIKEVILAIALVGGAAVFFGMDPEKVLNQTAWYMLHIGVGMIALTINLIFRYYNEREK